MFKVFYYILVLVFVGFQSPVHGQNLDKIIQASSLNKSDLGVCVVSHGEVNFKHNPDQLMTPASLSKILTAIAVLKKLTPEDKFEPKLLIEGDVQNGYAESPLYIHTEGDPSFVSEGLWVLVNHLTRENIQKIKGPIVVDTSLFDENYYDESRQSVRVDRAYDAPVSAASFNWNSVNVYVRPTQKGKKAQIIADPRSDYFVIQNQVETVSGSSNSLTISLDIFQKKERLTVRGTIGVSSPEVVKFAAIQNPHAWLGAHLIEFLKQRGITVENTQVEKGAAPGRARIVAKSQGWSLFDITDGMMKFSNNFIAEMLTKQIAVHMGHKKASISDGIKSIQKVMQTDYQLDPAKYIFINPSGFTHKNKISACDLSRVLHLAQKDFSVGPALIASLPRPGGEGTLRRRMKGGEQSIRAKTGLLSGVIGLAGYASNSKGEVFSFTFIYNGKESGEEAARNLFDRLALEVTKL